MAVNIPREVALKILYDVNEKGAYSNIAINKYLEENNLKELDRSLVTDLVYGTIKWKITIDWIIGQFSSVKIRKISPWIINILRLGVYQLLYTDKIPVSAACNESVVLAKRYGHSASSGFVNAVLRNIAKSRDKIVYPDKEKERINYLSVRYSHPEWMVEDWLRSYGAEFTENLLNSNNSIPDLTIRVNTLKTTKVQLVKQLEEAGITVEDSRYLEDALILKNPSSITRLEAFKKGLFQVQDESSMLVGRILDPKSGEFIMDVCSAPGGKATHIAQLMNNQGTVLARDIHDHKIKIIQESAKRLGTSIIKAEMYDAQKIDDNYKGKADRVLVDAPCTGLGIIRRKPDIKWVRKSKDLEDITELQNDILEAASAYVKPGGVLVYSTCTIQPEENERRVEKFIGNHCEFEPVSIHENLPDALKNKDSEKGYIQLYPNVHNIDGFFIAKMRKKE